MSRAGFNADIRMFITLLSSGLSKAKIKFKDYPDEKIFSIQFLEKNCENTPVLMFTYEAFKFDEETLNMLVSLKTLIMETGIKIDNEGMEAGKKFLTKTIPDKFRVPKKGDLQ